jgi:eukaryotic-like serine/threonine-protein kinase
VTTAADVYSLGAILYRLLTGQILFPTSGRTEAIRLAWEGMPDPPRKLNPRVDVKLEAICLKCLEREPAKRYASAEALAEDLDRWSQRKWPLAWTPPRHLRILRDLRRNGLAIASTACALFAIGALFTIIFFDPERVAERTAATLENEATRRPVMLLGATGAPRWSRWSMGQGNNIVWSGPDTPFTFAALDRSRLELLRKAPGPRYRFSADVKHETAHDHSKVGMYFGYSEQATPDEVKRYWWDLEFADTGHLARNLIGPEKGRKYGAIRLERVRQLVPFNLYLRPTDVKELFVSSEETKTLPTWRKIAVEIRPERVRFLWEGHTFHEMTLADLHKLGEAVERPGAHIPEVKFTVDGALGVFVNYGKASFRNIIVEPLE